jgi:hypothetical protein
MLKGVKGEKTFATYGRTVVERSFTKAKIEVQIQQLFWRKMMIFPALAEMKQRGRTHNY